MAVVESKAEPIVWKWAKCTFCQQEMHIDRIGEGGTCEECIQENKWPREFRLYHCKRCPGTKPTFIDADQAEHHEWLCQVCAKNKDLGQQIKALTEPGRRADPRDERVAELLKQMVDYCLCGKKVNGLTYTLNDLCCSKSCKWHPDNWVRTPVWPSIAMSPGP